MQRVIAAVLFSAVMLAGSWAAAADDIVIGAGFLLSGRFASYGEDAKAGVDLGVKEINVGGGVLGRKLAVDYEDTKADRAVAVANYRKWAARPEVVAMFSISTIEFLALDPVGPEVKLPFISIGSAGPVESFKPWSFRVQLIVSKAMGPVLNELKGLYGIKSVGVIFDTNNNYTVGEMETVKKATPTVGLALKDIEPFSSGDQDFSLQITRLKQNEPDLLYVAATTDEATLIISQARALGLKSRMIGGAGLNDPRIASLPGKAADGVMTFFPFDATDPRPRVQKFINAYKDAFRKDPPAYAALGYDAIRLLADAIARAGSLDRTKVRDALGSTRDFEGANGLFSYAGAGDNLHQKPNIFAMADGKFKRISK
ncbi:MAG: ABC transporter substrate-binding protein [Candidatus Lambdaproteobacteria bacterium]|nr:ABC transporter substrate-binding protein [Candidatus Lambdaproteobacteria bacterium]